MALTRAQHRRRQEQAVTGAWAALGGAAGGTVLAMVLKALEAAEHSPPQIGGWGGCKVSATIRLVSPRWQAAHDAMVERLELGEDTTDEAVGILVRRFPALTTVEIHQHVQCERERGVTDVAMLHLSSLTALASLHLFGCVHITAEGLRAVNRLPALTTLELCRCLMVTNEALVAVSELPALTALDLNGCCRLTEEGLRAIRGKLPALTTLNLGDCTKLTDAALSAVSTFAALTHLNLSGCTKLTSEGLLSLNGMPSLASLNLVRCWNVTVAQPLGTRLTALNLAHCENVTGIQALLGGANALTDLDLSHCCNITVDGLRALGGLTSITTLKLCACGGGGSVTDAVVSSLVSLTALTSLDLGSCRKVTAHGMRAVSSLPLPISFLSLHKCNADADLLRTVSRLTALSTLNLDSAMNVRDEGMLAVSSLPAITSLNLYRCLELTDEGMLAVSAATTLQSLTIALCNKVTNMGVRALSSLPALTFLDLGSMEGMGRVSLPEVTALGLQLLRRDTASSLRIKTTDY